MESKLKKGSMEDLNETCRRTVESEMRDVMTRNGKEGTGQKFVERAGGGTKRIKYVSIWFWFSDLHVDFGKMLIGDMLF